MFDLLAQAPSLAGHPAAWSFAVAFPWAFSGSSLHRLALHALSRDDHGHALALFERAGVAYRRELAVEALARLRVHELMARVRAGERGEWTGLSLASDPRTTLVLEAERRLAKLEWIESLEPPFTLVDAHHLLAAWWSEPDADAAMGHSAALAA